MENINLNYGTPIGGSADSAIDRPISIAAEHQSNALASISSAGATAAVQQVHIISSEDDELLSTVSCSGGSEFAGFSSAGATLHPVTSVCSSKHEHVFHEGDEKDDNVCMELQKRSSSHSMQESPLDDDVDGDEVAPMKRKKEEKQDDAVTAIPSTDNNTPMLQTPPDQIVEVCSDSTTNSQRQQRLQRSNKLQLNLNLHQQTANTNKCSTESTSEFPVSSPSNPQAGGSKFPQRTPLLKNTLPADSFERHLAMITARNPQMTLDEKMHAWQCDVDLSDIEDVNNFDNLFKKRESEKRNSQKSKKDSKETDSTTDSTSELDNYDFAQFRIMMRKSLNTQLRKDSITASPHDKDKPTTSAAVHLAAQRRLKAAAEAESKKRHQKDTNSNKKAHNSTTPPATSSSENEIECYPGTKKKSQYPQKSPQKILVYEKVLCPSSSEETSQDAAGQLHNLRSTHQPPPKSAAPTTATSTAPADTQLSPPLNVRYASTDDESVFRLHRLNREIDKNPCQDLIQLRLDYRNDAKDLLLKEKKSELFKTPTVPQKYLITGAHTNNNHTNAEVILTHCDGDSAAETSSAPPMELIESEPSVDASQLGAFHQQHEFCNYLGLTGMSTANAVANAVAELAKCNLARRSLRVRRLQQQEKKERSAKEEKQLEASKSKQARTMKQTEKSSRDTLTPNSDVQTEDGESCCKSVKSSPPLTRDTDVGNATAITPHIPTSALLMQTKKEPEIKILCHISATTHEEVKNESQQHVAKEVTTPIRQSLLSHLKRGTASSNGTSTCPRSSHSEADDAEETSSNPTPRRLQSVMRANNSPRLINRELASAQSGRSSHSPQSATYAQKVPAADVDDLEDPEHTQALHNKFQKYLEASRQTKPSIYIVQSLVNEEATKKQQPVTAQHENQNHNHISPLASGKPNTEMENAKNGQSKTAPVPRNKISHNRKLHKRFPNGSLRVRKSKVRLHKLLTRSTFNMSQQRQLRGRKILILKEKKSAKPKIKTKEKSTQKLNKETPTSDIGKYKNSPTIESLGNKSPMLRNYTVRRRRGDSAQAQHPDTETKVNPKMAKLDEQNSAVMPTSLDVTKETEFNLKSSQTEIDTKPCIAAVHPNTTPKKAPNDSEVVVVSSTTNSYDETALNLTSPVPAISVECTKSATYPIASSTIVTKEKSTQSTLGGIHYLTAPTTALHNPLKSSDGSVLYIYYEMDVLIAVQELVISFWKYSKLINALSVPLAQKQHHHQQQPPPLRQPSSSSAPLDGSGEWLNLGECKRLVNDIEISSSYSNRICVHNSIPVYMDMRCRELPHERRDCNLLSMYINVYYYNDEEMQAKMHSIQLDAVQSVPRNVIYTTITESRYFVMSWPQENILGKVRSGLCKYSLTPHLDTLASIREFKSMRHEIRYLECTDDDKLLGFGATQLTIWDHRSGDVLMNYDFEMPLGRNVGSIYYPSLEIGQNNMILIFQYSPEDADNKPELLVIACRISHASPSHRVLERYQLPAPAFSDIVSAINTSEHLLLTAQNDEEIWISCADPNTITCVPAQNTQRYYARGRTQLIELTEQALTVDSFANHVLKLAADPKVNL